MLVYGDHEQVVDPGSRLRLLVRDNGVHLDHDRLRSRFITLAGLVQGIADEDFRTSGTDGCRPVEAELLGQLTRTAAALLASWDAGCVGGIAPPIMVPADLPARVKVRLAEGYAFYALYPEAYGLAARTLRLDGPPRVIGLRSIGTGLAAMAAAALDAPPPVTLRPCGDPFARSVRIEGRLAADLLAGDPHFVIVDEGPGLSGSSFGAVADWLEEQGVPRRRIAFLPGHDGDLGPQAAPAHRLRWAEAQRPVAAIDRLRSWVEALLGPLDSWQDLSSGAWRSLSAGRQADWPAVTPVWERAKFLVSSGTGDWLVRFAGLGTIGEEKLTLARRLRKARFGPEVAGLTHGWLVQRWHSDAQPTQPSQSELIDYLRLRAAMRGGTGASLAELVTMVRRNAAQLGAWNPPIGALQQGVRPVLIDGKLQRHEWLRLPSGQLLKADAIDHHQGHDLIGCQDIAWDVASAAIELDLSAQQTEHLQASVGADPALTAFYGIAYAAFRIGVHRLSQTTVDPAEAARHEAAARRYELALVDAVEHARHVDQSLGLGIEAFA